jgi:hypothetical protein
MEKIFDSKPARFPNNNTEEYNSVIKLLDLLDKNQIKPDPKLIDKFPNTDGVITITDKEQFPIGKCEIQIKTLPDSEINTPKYQCELPFLSHCETSLVPVILIVVNTKNERAYWLHMDRRLLMELGSKITGKSISVHIPLDNIISRKDNSYIDSWIKILDSYIKKKIEIDVLEDYKKKYEELYKLIEYYPKPIHTIGNENLKLLNIFIDTLNNSYDGDFKSIKEVVFSSFWKISIAYTEFGDDRLSYAIIPIKYGDNDLLIREVSSINTLIRDKMARNIISYNYENPIKIRPVEYAFSLIKEETLEVIKKKHLQLICNQLAYEYLTDLYDYAKKILPIDDLDTFNVQEYSEIINVYLPIWAEEYNLFKNRLVIDSQIYFDLEEVFWHTSDGDKDIITNKALKRYQEKKYCTLTLIDTSINFSINYIKESLNLLLNQKLHKFKRPFPVKTFNNISGFVWSWYTPETAFKKLSFVFTELPIVYDIFVELFFPKLYDFLKFYSNFNLLIVNVKYKKDFKNFTDSPSIEMFYLQSNENIASSTKIYLNNEDCPLCWEKNSDYFDEGVVIDDIKYELKSSSGIGINHLYDRFTLRQFLYKFLEDRLEKYFKIKTNG